MIRSKSPLEFQPIHQELLDVLFLPNSDATLLWGQWKQHEDIDYLEPGIYELLPVLYRRLHKLLPDDAWMTRMRGVYKKVWTSNATTLRRVLGAVQSLERSDVDVMFIKGMGLLSDYNGDLGLRMMSDVDLLVHRDDVERANDILISDNWIPCPGANRELIVRKITRELHGWGFVKDQIQIDLHWNWSHRDLGQIDDESIWKTARWELMLGYQCLTPCATDKLLLALLHGIRPQHGRKALWVIDAMQIMNKELDDRQWAAFSEKVCKFDFQTVVFRTLGYLKNRYEAPIPSDLITKCAAAPRRRMQSLEFELLLEAPSRWPRIKKLSGRYLSLYRSTVGKSIITRANWVFNRLLSALSFLHRWNSTDNPFSRLPNLDDHVSRAMHWCFPEFLLPAPLDWMPSNCPVGEKIWFTKNGIGPWLATSGWALQEDQHLWSDGYQARLVMKLAPAGNRTLRVSLNLLPYLPPKRGLFKLDVAINQVHQPRLRLIRGSLGSRYAFFVPRIANLDDVVDVILTPVTPRRPSSEENSHDTRLLGVCMQSMRIDPVPEVAIADSIFFGKAGVGEIFLGVGWWATEDQGVWSAMPSANVYLPLHENLVNEPAIRALKIVLTTFSPKNNVARLTLCCGGRCFAKEHFQFNGSIKREVLLPLRQANVDMRHLELEFRVGAIHSPFESGGSDDWRSLGVMLHEVSILS